jgi:hypothetical protein
MDTASLPIMVDQIRFAENASGCFQLSVQDMSAESCGTTEMGQDDFSSLHSPRDDEVEYGHVEYKTWDPDDEPTETCPVMGCIMAHGLPVQQIGLMSASWVPAGEAYPTMTGSHNLPSQQVDLMCAPWVPAGEVLPSMKSHMAHNFPPQPIGLTCATWVPAVLPLGVPCNDVQLDAETKLLARAEECNRAAAELRAAAGAVRYSAVAVETGENMSHPGVFQYEETTGKTVSDSEASQYAEATDVSDGRTTVMLKNIPNNLTRDKLVDLVDRQGFKGCYDFLYLPVDFERQANLGYAFLNMISNHWANRFWMHFDGFSDWVLKSEKIGNVAWSKPLQGLQNHIDRYRNSPVMHKDVPEEAKPILLHLGEPVPFPEPNKRIRAPRMKAVLHV